MLNPYPGTRVALNFLHFIKASTFNKCDNNQSH